MISSKGQQRIFGTRDHLNQRNELRHFFLCNSCNELSASFKLCKQSTLGLHKVEHGITKREATPPFPPKFCMSQIIEWYPQTG